ncbi:LysR family transcriptional regulator [Insolitispirillum peregrinum]|uniref:LysR family transcriptional regulator n=1 Tax=Insolitispirillum peregrinum TaxID=80876 RepID=UPI00360EA2D2
MDLTLSDIRLIRKIAERGRMADVARELRLSPASVSARLKAAEDSLGAPLFLRTTRSLSLTEEGRRFLAASDGLVSAWEGLGKAVRGQQDEMAGPIRITASYDIGASHIAPVLQAFQADFPGVVLDLHLDDAVVDVVGGGFDIAIRSGALPDSRLKVRHLARGRRLVVASPAYLVTAGTPRTPWDLAEHRCIVRRAGGVVVDDWYFEQDGRTVAVRVPLSLITNDGAQTRRWALAGAGIALKSWLDVAEDLQAGRLVSLLPDWMLPAMPLHLVSPPRSPEPRRVTVLKERLIAHFQTLNSFSYPATGISP